MLGIGINNSIGHQAGANNRTRPLGALVDSCVFDLDVTLGGSYPGSGTDIINIETSPADSEIQSEYDFETGIGFPTFTGSANSPESYLSFDGSDSLLGAEDLSTFLDSIHKTTGGSDFTFVCTLFAVTGNQILMGNRAAAGANIGVILYSLGASNKIFLTQRGDTNISGSPASTGTLNAGQWNFVACSHKHSTNTTTLWLNGATGEATSNTFNATTTTASSTKFALGAYGSGTTPVPNTSRAKSFAVFNEALTDAQMTTVANQLSIRHKNTYV